MGKTWDRQKLLEPHEIAQALRTIFPDFQDIELDRAITQKEASLHTVWLRFSGYFQSDLADDTQLKILAELIETCANASDDLENAVATCFLEHLRQIDREHRLKAALSRMVKTRLNWI